MLTSPKTLEKMRRLESTYQALVYEPLEILSCVYAETDAHLRAVPGDELAWQPCPAGTVWGRAWGSAWFRATVEITTEQAGEPLYVTARTGGVEALFWLQGKPAGLFNFDPWVKNRGDHRAQLVTAHPAVGQRLDLAFEAYAGHPFEGCQPFDSIHNQGQYPLPFTRTFGGVELCHRQDLVEQFVLDLRALNQLSSALPAESFRKGEIDAALTRVFALVPQDPLRLPRENWRTALAEARELMKPLLARRNGDSAPRAGLVGHSHMDTAWHWTMDETIRKCARTYSNALRLMEQYPEYRFVQSSALHAEWMRRHYPAIFEGIQQRVAEGRWEPNGGGWIEPDVNLAGGEALIRHFLHGQAFTRKYFNYTSDTFWLPDTFGYSAALPQLLRGCGFRYFATTKLTWNETNTFPYDTFWWEGIDGTRVLAHFPDIHCPPDPETLINKLHGTGPKDFRVVQNCVRHKDVNQQRLVAYGFGDGGGGPDAQMIEMARRCRDLEGCPRAEHTTVSAFMKDLEQHVSAAPVYVGELYLECHRGTLTQMHEIKRHTRQAEFALREAEAMLVLAGPRASRELGARWGAAWQTFLPNQFHDILPGTSMPEVHDRATAELGQVIDEARAVAAAAGAVQVQPARAPRLTIFNTLGWRRDEATLTGLSRAMRLTESGVTSQAVETPWGEARLVVAGLDLPALGARSFALHAGAAAEEAGPFTWDGRVLESPHLVMRLSENGGLASLWLKAEQRELAAPDELPLNTFLFGEDVPAAWDNWDVDADLALKLKPALTRVSREVVARGPLQFRLRQVFTFGQGSRLVQDVVVSARQARIDFETLIQWRDPHHFLATVFPLAVRAPSARHEIQFGHLERPTHRNTAEDRARFEVCQHKWTDLSENRFGVALLNDGKYGVSVTGGTLRLSLHKGGTHPDPRGDQGDHICTYSLLPHAGGFRAETVVRPAYELNLAPTVVDGVADSGPLLAVDAPNVVVETVKPAEDGRGYIVRLYECERSATRARIRLAGTVFETNLLEEDQQPLATKDEVLELEFRPFEIKTLRVMS